ALLVPPRPPTIDELNLANKNWAERMAGWSAEQPFALVDTTRMEDPKSDQAYLEALVKKIAKSPSPKELITGEEFTTNLKDDLLLPKNADPFQNDFSAWVSASQQKRAWAALADARQALNTYQRSGHANLQRLDAAVEEMCAAESGP